MSRYAPLWCKSNFSFLEGASHPEELVEEAHRLGITSIALTDRDGVHGMVRAHTKARELGVQLIGGATVTVAGLDQALVPSPVGAPPRLAGLHASDNDDDAPEPAPRRPRRGRSRRVPKSERQPLLEARASEAPSSSPIVLLAMDRGGWASLTRLLTAGRRRCEKGESLVSWREVAEHAGGLCALWGGPDSLLAGEAPGEASRVAGLLRDAFGDRLYAMATRHRTAEEVPVEARLRARAKDWHLPVLAGGEVLYHSRARRPLQDVVTCIRHGVTLATAGRRIRGNDEHDLKSPHTFGRLWADDPAAVMRTLEVAERCRFHLGELRYRYPTERLPDGSTSMQHLRELARAGARRRYGEVPAKNAAQLESELALIEELDYPGYFLTMHEIVEYCRRTDILCQGRGSAANSVVCYCLGITAIDPMAMGFLFERFLSRERAEPPDIDLDIEHERREEVIQHVYAKYGRDHAAMVCNVIRYRPRSAVRDVGKVLGIPETALDRAAKLMSSWGDVEDTALARAGLGGEAESAHVHLARLAIEILEFPRHLSIHPGGFLLGHEPVHDIVPIENGTMPGRTVIQWDKDDLEELGLFKVDLLGLGALHHLHLCFDMLREHRGVELTLAGIPHGDTPTYDLMCTADTIGVFQIESRAQMSMLPRLRPRTFYDLVIEVSIVRPGPITGGMVHPYLRRKHGIEEVVFPHECLRPVLEKTLGVPLFQEQVMRLAIVAADYTPGEADQLRRDMAAWRRSGRIEGHREKLITRMQAKGIAPEFAERVFEQIRGFGEYGFPESHAASFAMIAYATSYLRCHYMAEFTCSLLNAQPMGFYSPATLVGDAQRHGIEIRPIDVAHSDWNCTLERTDDGEDTPVFAIRMGLRWVKSLSFDEGQQILRARAGQGFASLEDFARRTHLVGRAHGALAECGALGSLVPSRRDALWQLAGWARRQNDPLALGGDVDAGVHFPGLDRLDTILWDYRASDHSARGHPLAPMRGALAARGLPDARNVHGMRDGQRVDYAGLVICRQRPATASGVTFMTLEDETGFVNLVVWKQVFDEHAVLARTTSLLGVTGRLQIQEGIVHLIAERMWTVPLPRPVPEPESRDFR